MKKCALVLILIYACSLLPACSWVGETAGKVSAKMERKSNDVEAGYKRGYEQEKNKN